MPGNVDERVVEMRIDNKQFESGAKTTISTLEKLERALHLKSDSSAIDDMAKSMSNFDASPMTNSIDKVGEHLNALEIAGRRVIENLTDSIYGFATKTVKGLTIDQVSAGWDKYERKTEAVQSIMAATREKFDDEGEQMKFINDQLDRMMWYTDETSYNFVDMAQNVGKFLAAGVGLGEDQDLTMPFNAMMGIASWGASAGAKPQEVSRAMYNISQAMGAGSMKAIDWKSIENAGMATLEFKQNVIDTAEAMGKIRKVGNVEGAFDAARGSIVKYSAAVEKADQDIKDKEVFDAKSFREGLNSGWFDVDVMTEVFSRYSEFADLLYEGTQKTGEEASTLMEILDKYRSFLNDPKNTNKQFNWAKYAGESEEAIQALQESIQALNETQWQYSEQGFRMGQEAKTFSDAIEATKDAVSSKWMRTFQWVFGDYMEAKDFWTEITDRLYKLFAEGGDVRNDILEAWYWAGGRDAWFNLAKDEDSGPLGAFWNLLNAINGVISPIKEAFYEVFGLNSPEELGERLAQLSIHFREFTETIGFSDEAAQGLKNIFTVLFTGAKLALKGFGGVLGVIGKFAWFIGEVLDAVLSLASGEVSLADVQERLANAFQNFIGPFATIIDKIKNFDIRSIPDSIAEVVKYLMYLKGGWTEDFLEKMYNSMNGFEKLLVNAGKRFPFLIDVFSKVGSTFENLFNKFPKFELSFGSVVEWFYKLKDAISGIHVDLSGAKGLFGNLGEVANMLITSLFGDMSGFKEKINATARQIFDWLYEAVSGIKFTDILKVARIGLTAGFFGGFLEIVRSFHMVANEVKSIPEAITDTLGALQKSFQATSYIKMAVAIGILAASIYALSKVPADDFMRVVLGLGILALVLQKLGKGINIFSGSNNQGDTITKGLKANIKLIPDLAATIIALAAAIGIMAHAVVSFKKNGIEKITDVLLPLGVFIAVLLSMLGFLYLLKKFDVKDVGKSFGLLITVFAIIGRVTSMAKTVKNVPLANLAVTLGGMVGILIALAFLLRFSSGFKKFKDRQILHVAVLMLAIGVVIDAIGRAVKRIGKLKFTDAVQGVVGVGLLLAAMLGMVKLISTFDTSKSANIMKIAGSIALMALSINMLIVPLMALAALPFWKMIGAIVGLGALLTVLGGALVLMSKMGDSNAGAMLKIAGALALVSLGLALVLPSLIVFTTFLVGLAAALKPKMIAKLVGLSVAMVLLGAGLLVAGAGIALFGLGMLGVAASALMFSVALLAIASGLDKLGTAFPQFIQGLIDAGKMMTADNAKDILKGAAAFGALALAVFLLAKAFGALFGSGDVLAKLGCFGGKLVTGIGNIIRNVGSTITGHIPEILKILGAVAVAAGLYMIGIIPKLTSWAVQAIVTLLESIHQSIRANKDVLEHSIFGMVEVLLEVLFDAGTWVFSLIRGLIDTGVTWLLDMIADKVKDIPLVGDDIAKSIKGITAELPTVDEIMKQWGDQKSKNAEWLQQFVPPAGELKDASAEVPKAIGSGILEGQSSITDALDGVRTTIDNSMEGLQAPMEQNGNDAIMGLNNGIVGAWNSGLIQGNLDKITSSINRRTRLGLGEHSPSKIAAESGAFYIIGLANGITDNAKLPLDAIDETTDPMVEALKKAMTQIATMSDEDFSFSPVITPVVDMSNVSSAAGSMNGLFGSMRTVASAQAERYSGYIPTSSRDSAITNEIQSLSSRMDTLGEAITNMQIVLDTGVLVGATSAKMDARLGVLAARKGRGN